MGIRIHGWHVHRGVPDGCDVSGHSGSSQTMREGRAWREGEREGGRGTEIECVQLLAGETNVRSHGGLSGPPVIPFQYVYIYVYLFLLIEPGVEMTRILRLFIFKALGTSPLRNQTACANIMPRYQAITAAGRGRRDSPWAGHTKSNRMDCI
jgi:hypothetical protein